MVAGLAIHVEDRWQGLGSVVVAIMGACEPMVFSQTSDPGVGPVTKSLEQPIPVSDTPGPSGRWWWGIGVGSLVSLPLAWLLSYGAALPFFLGLFFFMLFGLMIGAAVYRVAAPGAPYAKLQLLLGTTFLVVLTFGTSLWKEARDFPEDVARKVTSRTRDIGGRTAEEFRTAVANDIRALLADRYGPGSNWGYIRWVLTNGEINRGDLPTVEKGVSMPAAQVKVWWAFRVVASMGLLGFGISSQTLLLKTARQAKPPSSGDRKNY